MTIQWANRGTLRGPQGPEGPEGPQGPVGADGGTTPHADRHAVGGTDPVTPASIGAAADADVVHKTGNETIAGQKTVPSGSSSQWIFNQPPQVAQGTATNHAVRRDDPRLAADAAETQASVRTIGAGALQAAAGTAPAAAVAAHEAAGDPHPQYLTAAEGTAAYQPVGSYQAADSDLSAIAALAPADGAVLRRIAGAWSSSTIAEIKTALALAKADVGLGSVDNTSDAAKPVSTAQQTAINGRQPIDDQLTALAALAPVADQFPYFTSATAAAVATVTAFSRTVLAAADAAAARTLLGAVGSAEARVTADQAAGTASIRTLGTGALQAAAGTAPAAAAAAAVATHEAAGDPHPQYLTQPEGDGRYALIGAGGSSAAVAPAGPSPASILNIGPRAGQNHFALQAARLGEGAPFVQSVTEIAAGYEESPLFVGIADKTEVAMRAYVGAPPTSGSSYARTEFREVGEDGSNYGFDALDAGTHRAQGRFRITHAPPVMPDLVVAQLHNTSADRVAIRTQLVSGTWRLRIRINGSTATLDGGGTDIVVGQGSIENVAFDWKIEVIAGTVRVYVGDMVTPKVTSSALVSTGGPTWYFKAGVYLQTNTTVGDTAAEYGEVQVSNLSHWHTGWATPAPFYAAAKHAPAHAIGGYDPLTPAMIGAAPASHPHSGADITSGVLDPARLPDLSATYIPLSQKGASNGVAALTGTVLPRAYYQYATGALDGTIVLAGDLGGTATAPTVPDLANKANRALAVRTISASGAVLDSDDVILADTTSAALTLTLPTAVGRTGRDFLIKKIGANALTIATTSSQTIDGVTTEPISMANGFREVVSDGANWRIRGGKIDPVIAALTDTANGGTVTINAAAATVYRGRLTGAGATLAAPTNPIDGDVVNVELYPTVACSLSIAAAVVLTGGITSPIALPAGKLWSAALRYRAATSPATSAAAWRLLASSADN